MTLPAAGPEGADEAAFRQVLGHFATGVTVVTAVDGRDPVGFTCQAFTSLSLDPPMVALAPGKASTSWPRIARAGAFCVNILAAHQEALCTRFAAPGPGKFDGVRWHPGATGAPVLEGVLAFVECELGIIHDAGDHELVTGRVVALGMGSGDPLLFYRGSYGTFRA
ncbi:MAG TPA: flavin reductase family protein [Acidimicrobiales bacterium]|nr:flavin reductase family protein [Acidimicrobiales bacterium]